MADPGGWHPAEVVALAAVISAAVTAFVGFVLSPWLTAQHAERAWRMDRRAVLYGDLLLWSFKFAHATVPPTGDEQLLMGIRVGMFASPKVRETYEAHARTAAPELPAWYRSLAEAVRKEMGGGKH